MKLGDFLKEKGYISSVKLNNGLNEQAKENFLYNRPTPLGKILIKLGYIDKKTLEEALDNQNGCN